MSKRKLPHFVPRYVGMPDLGMLALAGIDRDPGKRVTPGRAVFLVYRELSICSHNGRRLVNYGRKSLGERLGIGEATAWRALRALQDAGVIQKAYQSLGGRWANGWRVLKSVAGAVVRDFSRIRAPKRRIYDDTPTNQPTVDLNNRPLDGYPQRGQPAEYESLLTPEKAPDTSETADWAAINQILALGGAMPESIP